LKQQQGLLPGLSVLMGARHMNITDAATAPNQPRIGVAAAHAAVGFGYTVALALYAAIFALALVTLGLVLVRQANMVNFNDLVATLEQRDRAKVGLPQVLESVRRQRELYRDAVARSAECLPVSGHIRNDELLGHDPAASAHQQLPGAPPTNLPRSCDELQNTIKNHANELQLTEDRAMFKLAHIDAYYMDYIAGMTQKMPQIAPALRFLDSGNAWVASWARSSFELMEMFLLVAMGMLGGIISATRWLVDRASRKPVLAAYFYKPALGGIIAMCAFVVFKAGQLIIGAHAQDGAMGVTASIFLLAALGLVSGLGADKALEQIEKAAGLFRPEAGSAARQPAPQEAKPLLQVVRSGPAAGVAAPDARPGRHQLRSVARPKVPSLSDEVASDGRMPEWA
jgi:hypothetical protein